MQGDLLQLCQAWSPSLPPWPLWRLLENSSLDAAALLVFAVDGDNTQDALRLASHAAQLLSLALSMDSVFTGVAWQQPLSWSSVYGGEGLA